MLNRKTIQLERYNDGNIFFIGFTPVGEIAFADFIPVDSKWEKTIAHFKKMLDAVDCHTNLTDILEEIKNAPVGAWKRYVRHDGYWDENGNGLKNEPVRVIVSILNIGGDIALHFKGVEGEEPPEYDSENTETHIDACSEDEGKSALIADVTRNGFSREIAEIIYNTIKKVEKAGPGERVVLVVDDFKRIGKFEAQMGYPNRPKVKELWLTHRAVFKMDMPMSKFYEEEAK